MSSPTVAYPPTFLSNDKATALPETNGIIENATSLSVSTQVTEKSTPIVGGEAIPPAVNSLPPQEVPTSPNYDFDIIIVGAGPSGASLACFLSSHGVSGLMISSTSRCADTPRAHITNISTLR